MRYLFSLSLMLGLCHCTHSIHSYHVSDFEPVQKTKGKTVTATTEQFTILGFVTQTDYVEDAYSQLQRQCKGGYIKGITTQFLTHHGFFSWTNEVILNGMCVR